ncbi:DUF4190 domain-containing protein [Microbacterium sp. NPDC058389]|uniref:DUF4190 domain-containing protein n=1 Tax=Microbacterium sp. NPDC058389 TaxID=3346475 RepID=UPI0036590733
MTDPQSPVDPAQQPPVPPVPPAGDAAPAAPEVPAYDAPAAPAYDAPAAPAAEPVAPVYGAVPPAPPAYGAPAAPGAAPAYAAAPPAPYGAPAPGAPVPGKTLGIVALVVVFFASLIGLILGYIARSQSKKAGVPNTPAKVAIILGWIFLVLGIIAAIILTIVLVSLGSSLAQICAGYDPGVYTLSDGSTITCP